MATGSTILETMATEMALPCILHIQDILHTRTIGDIKLGTRMKHILVRRLANRDLITFVTSVVKEATGSKTAYSVHEDHTREGKSRHRSDALHATGNSIPPLAVNVPMQDHHFVPQTR